MPCTTNGVQESSVPKYKWKSIKTNPEKKGRRIQSGFVSFISFHFFRVLILCLQFHLLSRIEEKKHTHTQHDVEVAQRIGAPNDCQRIANTLRGRYIFPRHIIKLTLKVLHTAAAAAAFAASGSETRPNGAKRERTNEKWDTGDGEATYAGCKRDLSSNTILDFFFSFLFFLSYSLFYFVNRFAVRSL